MTSIRRLAVMAASAAFAGSILAAAPAAQAAPPRPLVYFNPTPRPDGTAPGRGGAPRTPPRVNRPWLNGRAGAAPYATTVRTSPTSVATYHLTEAPTHLSPAASQMLTRVLLVARVRPATMAGTRVPTSAATPATLRSLPLAMLVPRFHAPVSFGSLPTLRTAPPTSTTHWFFRAPLSFSASSNAQPTRLVHALATR